MGDLIYQLLFDLFYEKEDLIRTHFSFLKDQNREAQVDVFFSCFLFNYTLEVYPMIE